MQFFVFQALVYGASGSLHCLGMCGPLALVLPIDQRTATSKVVSILIYSLGRIFSYALIGLAVGALGSIFKLVGFQDILSILCGLLLILMSFSFNNVVFPLKLRFISNFNQFVQKSFNLALNKISNSKLKLLIIGIVNGFLPCGFLYMAVLSSLALPNLADRPLYMVAFGLGTIPIFIAIAFALRPLMSGSYRGIIRYLLPVITIIVGIILILRGLNLGIPMISPHFNPAEPHQMHCH